jgi:phosphoglycerate kinase
MVNFKTMADMPDVTGKRVLVRSELNVPIEDGVVTDVYRIEKAVPTIQELTKRGARVIVMAHIGRDPENSFAPVYPELQSRLDTVHFVKDVVGEEAKNAVQNLQNGEVLLLENLRSNAGEKANDPVFAEALAQYADYYVGDAFGNMHRAHASIVGVPALRPHYAGLLVEAEVKGLERAHTPTAPSLCILGGAKFETKEALLKTAVERYDSVFVGGAIANDFFVAQGYTVGDSLISENQDLARELCQKERVYVPKDVVVQHGNTTVVKHVAQVHDGDVIVDIGPEAITELGMHIAKAKDIIWNGPLGFFEKGFSEGTKEVAQLIADSTAHSIIGGGESVELIRNLALEHSFDFISTGGGAMLDFLVEGKLPGLDALAQ